MITKSKKILLFVLSLLAVKFIFNSAGEGDALRKIANISPNKGEDQILVFRQGLRPYLVKAPDNNRFEVRSLQSGLAIEKLKNYLLNSKQSFGISNDSEDFSLQIHSVHSQTQRTFVSFNQVQQRNIIGEDYAIPVSGGSIVITLREFKIDRVNTSLKSIRKRDFSFNNPGFDFSEISNQEFFVLTEQIAQSNNRGKIENYFNEVIRKAGIGQSFNIEEFVNLSPEQQRFSLEEMFGELNRIGTLRMLISLARAQRLSLVQYGVNKNWMYTISQPFDLDLEFDIEIPPNNEERLKVKNLRVSSYDHDVKLHLSPHYPIELGEVVLITNNSGDVEKVGENPILPIDKIIVQKFFNLKKYYEEKYSWNGLTGDSTEKNIVIHSQIKGRYLGSARWSAAKEVFLFGANGRGWVDKGHSHSIVGHEYFHALIHYSSALVYRGESGALNEHLADIQGVMFEADSRNSGKFDYNIGDEGIFDLSTQQELSKQFKSWINKNNINSEITKKYSLDQPQLRNLYYPEVSKHKQFTAYQDYAKDYPQDCEPSVSNDNCGVHYGSGVLNKAVSRIIEKLGLEKVRKVIFNTAIYRLNSNSNFEDYGLQLFEECRFQSSVNSESKLNSDDCEIIVNEFSNVGILLDTSPIN